MKKLFLILTFSLLFFRLQAQHSDLIQRIRSAGEGIKSFEATLTNCNKKKSGKVRTDTGKIYFVSPNEFAALFNSGKYMIVNEEQMKMNIGLFHGTFKTKEGGMMTSLGNIFLYGFQGKCQDLAEENDYSYEIKEDEYYTVTFTNNKKAMFDLGYQQVVFHIHKDDLLVKEIILLDTRGTLNTFSISDLKYNVEVSGDKFK